MYKKNTKNKLLSFFMIMILSFSGSLIFIPILPIIQNTEASSEWNITSGSEFINGTAKKVTIKDTDLDGEIKLNLTGTWTSMTLSPNPGSLEGHAMAPVYGTSNALLVGGGTGSSTSNKTWIFSQSSLKWTQKTNLNEPRESLAVAANSDDNEVLAFGGTYSNSIFDSDFLYDGSTNSWTSIAITPVPAARKNHAMASNYAKAELLLYGGEGDPVNIKLNDTWIFNFNTKSWSKKHISYDPGKRWDHGLATVYGNDKIVMFGGSNLNGLNDQTWVYDFSVEGGKWTNMDPKGDKPSARAHHAMTTIYGDDKVLLYGGMDSYGKCNDTWAYDISDNIWQELKPKSNPGKLTGHTITSIDGADGIILYGGTGGSTNTWLFNIHYVESGTYESPIYDTGGVSSLTSISWNADIPLNTAIKFQIRTAKTEAELIDASLSYGGPNNDPSAFFVTSGQKIMGFPTNHRFVQFKAELTTSDFKISPTLKDVTISFNNLPITTLTSPIDKFITNNNQTIIKWSIEDSDSVSQTGYQIQLDDNISFDSIDYDSGQIMSAEISFTPDPPLPDGNWYCRIRTSDSDNSWGPYSVYTELTIDTEPPAAFIPIQSSPGWTANRKPLIEFSTNDITSGVDFYQIQNNESEFINITSPYELPEQENGIQDITIRAYDNAGNYKDGIGRVYIDRKPPNVKHTHIKTCTAGRPIVVSADVSDDGLSGVNSVELFYTIKSSTTYSNIPMIQQMNSYIAEIPDEPVSIENESIRYFIKAIDNSTPSNEVFFCSLGGIDKQPTDYNDFDISITNTDTSPPTIIDRSPYNGETEVQIGTPIHIMFSEEMVKTSVESAFSMEPKVEGKLYWDDATENKLTFSLTSKPLEYNTKYTVSISTNAKDLAGNNLESDFVWSFTTTAKTDDKKPTITRVSPDPQETDVSISSYIAVTFSEQMNQGETETAFNITPEVTGTFNWEAGILNFQPDILEFDTLYTVTIGTRATDLAGNTMNEFTWTFNTMTSEGITQPQITLKTPAGTDTPLDTNIKITFSEEMYYKSVEDAFSIEPAVDGTFAWAGNTLTFEPDSLLKDGTTYTVTISKEAKSYFRQDMIEDYSWTFTTVEGSGGDDAGPNLGLILGIILVVVIIIIILIFFLLIKRRKQHPRQEIRGKLPPQGKMPKGKMPKGKMPAGKAEETISGDGSDSEYDNDIDESEFDDKGDSWVKFSSSKGKTDSSRIDPDKGDLEKDEIVLRAKPKIRSVTKEEPSIKIKSRDDQSASDAMIKPTIIKLKSSMRCDKCGGLIPSGLNAIECNCDWVYHLSCASRVGKCMHCDVRFDKGYITDEMKYIERIKRNHHEGDNKDDDLSKSHNKHNKDRIKIIGKMPKVQNKGNDPEDGW